MTAKQQDGQGVSKVTTPEQHNEARRQKKAKQKQNAKAGNNGRRGESFLDGLVNQQKARAAEARHQREAEEYYFRVSQASKAEDHVWYQQLKQGTLAHTVAHRVLEEFPLAESREDGGQKVSRTNVAVELAVSSLSPEQVEKHENAIRHGVNVARKALAWAYSELRNPSSSEDETSAEESDQVTATAEEPASSEQSQEAAAS